MGPEGGQYVCPIGALVASEDRRQVVIQLRRSAQAAPRRDYTGFDVAQRLLDMANPSHPAYRSDWQRQMAAVTVRQVYDVYVDLQRPHLRIEAVLAVPLSDLWRVGSGADTTADLLSPYRLTSQTADETVFSANPDYLLASPSQPREIVEKYFRDASEAVQALRRGEIDVLERVFPAEVPDLQRNPDLVVQPYAIPSLHMLIPNMDRPYLSPRLATRGGLWHQSAGHTGSRDPGWHILAGLPSHQRTLAARTD